MVRQNVSTRRPAAPSRARPAARLAPRSVFAGVALTAILGPIAAPAAANWSPDEVNIERQMSLTAKWGVIRVSSMRFAGVTSDKPETWVDFEFVDLYGHVTSQGTLWQWGADTDGGRLRSGSARFEVGAFYVVLLRATDHGTELIAEAMSAFRVENLTPGQLSPWDPVHFGNAHRFVPAGQSAPVSDAQLYEVVDGLAALEQRIIKAKGIAP